MSEKLLVVILSSRNGEDRVRQGLILTRDLKKLDFLREIRLLFYGSGVEWLALDLSGEVKDLLEEVKGLGVEIAACSANVRELGLDLDVQEQGVKIVGAPIYIADRLSEGFTIMTF
ncbi:DsrE family protein [Candidatus Hecatella orcuttiae]|uniref:DsrE family protein n=1 Tax=Candidatus Hecatella orcuttiae TaxID=1935119 RepID=UPI002867FF7B|nr:DsrE family protein [Candidatus Hecatella orcuttiae]